MIWLIFITWIVGIVVGFFLMGYFDEKIDGESIGPVIVWPLFVIIIGGYYIAMGPVFLGQYARKNNWSEKVKEEFKKLNK